MTMVGTSAAFQRAVTRVEKFAPTGMSILLIGETGTGKELFARHIHAHSGRQGQFVDINCGAVPRDMIESLLFGHRRGAFTGALEDTTGLIAQAEGGTLFLDELSSLPLEGQAKLLRVLETRELRRLGDTIKRAVDFRTVAAVQEDFHARVNSGALRRDLFQRIAGVHVMPLSTPPPAWDSARGRLKISQCLDRS